MNVTAEADRLSALADTRGVRFTADADEEAVHLCESTDALGPNQAKTVALRSWQDGTRPSPAQDLSDFVILAVEVYCPEHLDLFGR